MISELFKTSTGDAYEHAQRYLEGLVTETPRKNLERMDERLEASDYEGLQHFLSSSPWQERRVYDFIAERADERLGGRPESLLVIDESGFTKKGCASAGVSRQHNGRLGKQDNCQVGVFSALNCGCHSALIGAHLFLPEEWTEDSERCERAGVPESRIRSLTKIDLARELVEQALEQGVRFGCVSVDAFYGRDSRFLEWMNREGLIYCADVPANALVFTKRPKGDKRPKKMREAAQRVDRQDKQISRKKGKIINIREGENGLVGSEVWVRRVWVWPAEAQQPRQCWLLVSRLEDGTFKTSLCNAPQGTSIQRLSSWQAGRYFIERTFQDGKSQAGMAQYQARGWRAWHHHMAMVSLALLFMMEQRLLLAQSAPLLSARDIVELLEWHLVGPRSQEEVVNAIERRHRKRERNALSAQNRRREAAGLPEVRKMRLNKLPK